MAATGATLTTAMRSNMLTLQSLQQKIGASQTRLGSGNKIAASVDNPPVYFAAKGLDERANDMMALKDAMGQAISTVKAADEGVQHIGELVEHAKGLTVAALQNLGDDPASQQSRRKLAEQYDGLLAQIDEMAEDSGYGGKNLINNVPTQFLPSVADKVEATSVPGIRRIDVSNANDVNTYKVRVHGDGAITASEDSLRGIDNSLGLKNFRLFGFNSLTQGNFDDLTVNLRRQGADKAVLSVRDGGETRDIEIDLTSAANVTRPKAFRTEFQSGAWVAFDYDVADLAKRLTDSAVIELPVGKNIDLSMDVTDNSGRTVSHSLTGQDGGNRIVAGENSFIFDGGTVRVDVDPKLIQQASNYGDHLTIDGPLKGALSQTQVRNRTKDGSFDLHYEEQYPNYILTTQPSLGLEGNYNSFYSSNIMYPATQTHQQFPFREQTVLDGNGWFDFQFDPGVAETNVTSGIRIIQEDPFGPSVIPMTGTWSYDDYPLGWSGFQTNTSVKVKIDNPDSGGVGQRQITITEETGGQASLTVGNGDYSSEDAFQATLSGGMNDGAKVFIYAPSAGEQTIRVFAQGSAIYPNISTLHGIHNVPAYLSNNDRNAMFGVKYAGIIGVQTSADDSGGIGYRKVDITVGASGIPASSFSYAVPNSATSDQKFSIDSGVFAGMKFQLDFDTGSGYQEFFVNPPPSSGSSTPTTVIYRAANPGKPFELNVQQHTRATDSADLRLQLGTTLNDNLTVRALNLTTNGTGLAVDRSINGWGTREDIEKAAVELDRATQKLRSASTELSSGMNIITTRETFTKEFSDVLSEGASKLTLLDQNEEGSNLLMLQTRQQLSMTALSLAAKSQQSILNLF